MDKRPIQWIVSYDTGSSSKTIWAVMMGVDLDYPSIPFDRADFGRCFRLLELMPEWRGRLPELADKYPSWVVLIENWEKLEQVYKSNNKTAFAEFMFTLRQQ